MQTQEAIEKFCNSKGNRFEVAGRSYRRYVTQFFDFIKKPLNKLDNDDIIAFQMHMKTRYQDSTRALYSTALREFFKFTNGRGWTKINKEEISINKVYSKVMPYVVQENFSSLCDITKDDPIKALAVRILWLCGPRITELITLRKENINLEEMSAAVKNLKHSEHESIKFISWDEETNELLKQVVASNSSEWVFPSRKTQGHLTARQVQRWFVDFREKAGITTKITPHAMRRGFVKDNLNVGLPLPHLQQMGGWQSLSALQKYTSRYSNDIKDVANEALRKRKALGQQEKLLKVIYEKNIIEQQIKTG